MLYIEVEKREAKADCQPVYAQGSKESFVRKKKLITGKPVTVGVN
jgi:hypothetical protein